jgi:hypothetical protein
MTTRDRLHAHAETDAARRLNQGKPVDVKAHLAAADTIIDALPWATGRTPAQQRLARGRAAALAHQVAALLAGGWTLDEARAALAAAPNAAAASDAAAQERLWRGALKRAKNARTRGQAPGQPPHRR